MEAANLPTEEAKETFENIYKCPICLNLLYNPITVPCGHSFCQECFDMCMAHSQECPVCKEKLFLPSAPKINLVLKEIIETKYPDAIKQIKAQKEPQTKESNADSKKIKCFCIRKPNFHLMPKERFNLTLDRETLQQFALILQLASRCAVVSDLDGEQYGCLVEPDFLRARRNALAVVGQGRVKVTRMSEEYIETVGHNLTVCEGELLEDEIPSEEHKQIELIGYAGVVYEMYKEKLDNIPQVVREELKAKYDQEPYLSHTASMQAKLKFVEQISLYIVSTLNAGLKNPKILYTKNSMERLKWCRETMENNKNPMHLFRAETGGMKAIAQFLLFFIACIAVLFAARYSKFTNY